MLLRRLTDQHDRFEFLHAFKESMKKPAEEQNYFTQRREVLEGAKKRKGFHFACLCVLAPLCGKADVRRVRV